MNFVFPILLIIQISKELHSLAVGAGVVILRHYIDFFNMIMPGTVER
jgi:hypothetical protein